MVKASMKARLNSKVPQILPYASNCFVIPSIVWLAIIRWPIPSLIEARPMLLFAQPRERCLCQARGNSNMTYIPQYKYCRENFLSQGC